MASYGFLLVFSRRGCCREYRQTAWSTRAGTITHT
jgi:hypothetical protein